MEERLQAFARQMSCVGIRCCNIANGSAAAAESRSRLGLEGPEVAFDASCACALTLLRSPGKRRNLAQLQRQPNDRRPGRFSEHEHPAPETTTTLLASRWISAAGEDYQEGGQHAV